MASKRLLYVGKPRLHQDSRGPFHDNACAVNSYRAVTSQAGLRRRSRRKFSTLPSCHSAKSQKSRSPSTLSTVSCTYTVALTFGFVEFETAEVCTPATANRAGRCGCLGQHGPHAKALLTFQHEAEIFGRTIRCNFARPTKLKESNRPSPLLVMAKLT
jgi:hypothetical protein